MRGGSSSTGRKLRALAAIPDQAAQRRGERRDIVRRDQDPAVAGTVSGIAPAVVPITGEAVRIASA